MVRHDITLVKLQRLLIGCRCSKGVIVINYHNITYPDMNNGEGLRVVLWLSGCSHHCKGCQNPQTWDTNSGIPFDENAKEELFGELRKDYISGITFTGGDPLHENNLDEVLQLILEIRSKFPSKTIWLYSGYEYKYIFRGDSSLISKEGYHNYKRRKIIESVDVLVDGKYIEELRDISLHWRGSSNQRVIDVQKSLKKGEVILWDTN